MCAKYSLPPFDWLKLSHHLVSGESTLHEVTLFEARSRIFLPTAESCAALFCCRLAILRSDGSLAMTNKETQTRHLVRATECTRSLRCFNTVFRRPYRYFSIALIGFSVVGLDRAKLGFYRLQSFCLLLSQ